MFQPNDILPYTVMCVAEGARLRRGMNFRARRNGVFLMGVDRDPPYQDRISVDGRVLVYQGHDAYDTLDDPATVDQPLLTRSGSFTPNGRFYEAAMAYKQGGPALCVTVYEKIRPGLWAFNGPFDLVDAWQEPHQRRFIVMFQLAMLRDVFESSPSARLIPSAVKRAVWARDRGRCTVCGTSHNLRFDNPLGRFFDTRPRADHIQLRCPDHRIPRE